MRFHLSTPLLAVAVAMVAPALHAQSSQGATPAVRASTPAGVTAADPDLATVRRATERFRDVKVALAEGYLRDPRNICDSAELMGRPAALGAMGIHFIRPDLLGITAPPSPRVNGTGTHTDFTRPAVLIYEPQRDSSLELVAVENLVFASAWEKAGHTSPPTYLGVPWDRMADDPSTTIDEAHMFEPHYDRHVWLYRENPNGVFAQFNPNVSCKHHPQQGGHKH